MARTWMLRGPLDRAIAGAVMVALALFGSLALAQTWPTQPAGGVPGGVAPSLAQAQGRVEVIVALADEPLAVRQGAGGKQRGLRMDRAQAQGHLAKLLGDQDAVLASIRALGGVEVARLTKALNAVIISVDATRLEAVAALPGVTSVRPVINYQQHQDATLPYIGATAAQAAGRDGSGVRVAVLDSGIDFTHRNLGGPGTVAAYSTCYAQRDATPSGACAALFGPGAPKVVGGFDFVGEQWPNGPRSEDPNPIDRSGHGTHVADILAGRSADGLHRGVAPGAKLYAVKVCSAVSRLCNGVAILRAIELALDPDGEGDIADAVDVINLSLGYAYGQQEHAVAEAAANAARFGVVVVASAGNETDRPYVMSSPASAPEVISVAQTQVPDARIVPLQITAPASIAGVYANTAALDFAPLGAGFSGEVVYLGRACRADVLSADPTGKVALVDRGVCNVSEKVRRASDAGAVGVLVGLVAPGDAAPFSNGGDCPVPPNGACKPTLVITQSTSQGIKENLGAPVRVVVSPANALSLAGSVVASSSRGPSYSTSAIKPDIGAPGAIVSAVAGAGDGTEAFGGTSGAAPVVAGAAAILIQAFPERSAQEIRALLMNTAEPQILTNPATLPGVLAPITRIGSGEVRLTRALDATAAAWDSETLVPSLSFGYRTVSDDQTFRRSVTVRNFSRSARTFSIVPRFRYPDDAASAAVALRVPGSITVPPNGTASFDVQLRVSPRRLPAWTLNGGERGGAGPLLETVEYDGSLSLRDGGEVLNLPWHVLPRRSADVMVGADQVSAGANLLLTNRGAAPGRAEVFSLTGTSPRIRKAFLPEAGDDFAVIDQRWVGVRQSGENIELAVHTFGRRAHPNYPAEFDVFIDSNADGTDDYLVYNMEVGGFAATGQNGVHVLDLRTGARAIYFYTDADLGSANVILPVPMSAVGLAPERKFRFSVVAYDNYFTLNPTDAVENMVYTPGVPRFVGTGVPASGVPVGGTSLLSIQKVNGGDVASPSQSGLLLMFRDGRRANEAAAIKVNP